MSALPTSDSWNGPLGRGAARVAGILWLAVVVGLAMVLAVRTTPEPLGDHDLQSCHLPWFSQVPQVIVGASGCVVLIASAERHRLGPWTIVAALATACAWALLLYAVPPAFDKICAN
jgi:cytochrome bd-type quinol oxidase subunit 2